MIINKGGFWVLRKKKKNKLGMDLVGEVVKVSKCDTDSEEACRHLIRLLQIEEMLPECTIIKELAETPSARAEAGLLYINVQERDLSRH